MARTTLLLFLCMTAIHVSAQNLTGKWQGSFITNGDVPMQYFTYELVVQENASHQIMAQTITKKAGQFYASAFASGNHSISTQLVQIDETSFDQLKIAPELEACLMYNFLTYKNIDGHEILEGSFMSAGIDGKRNCGSGQVFLEKVSGAFKVKNSKPASTQNALPKIKSPITAKNGAVVVSKMMPTPDRKNTKALFNSNEETEIDEVIIENTTSTISASTSPQNTISNQPINLPWVLVGRENKLVKKIITNNKKISIDLFDNGTIDNDTIMVFDNKQLIVNKQRLSYKSIHLEFNFTENMREHEVIIVAHNMGAVPPNTALLLFKDGANRKEYFITSTNKINAKLLIVYEPPIQE